MIKYVPLANIILFFYEDDCTQDGCVCDIGKHEYHIDNCYECDIGEFKECPYYKKVLLED